MRPQKILLPFSWIYGAVVGVRNTLFDRGTFKMWKAAVPVISVGNITAGGTGKTPFVEYLVRYLIGLGKRVAIISRGYKRDGSEPVTIPPGVVDRGNAHVLGDEPFQMARKFPQVAVLVDANRRRAAASAVEKYDVDVIVLDDGFQHRALARDLDIVLLDAAVSSERIPFLPAGLMREPSSSLRRADLLAYTGVGKSGSVAVRTADSSPEIRISSQMKRICNISLDTELRKEEMKGKKCVAFCGIGNPASFRNTLEGLGITVSKMIVFPDHHYFTDVDLSKVRAAFRELQCDLVLTTEKDAVRVDKTMARLLPGDLTFYLEIETVITQGEELLKTMIDEVLQTNDI